MSVKINTHGDDNVIVYCTGKVPVFYHIFKSLFPTGKSETDQHHMKGCHKTLKVVFR